MKPLAEKVSQNKNFDVELINLVAKLHTQLVKSKGKKVYGYLKSDVKKTVDEIFMRIASKVEMPANTIFSLFVNLSRCIEDDYHHKFQSGRKMIDSKLRRIIQEKKQSLGIRNEQSIIQKQNY